MKDSSLFFTGSFLALSLVVVGCGGGGEDTAGTGGSSSGGASTGGTSSGGSSTGGGASGGAETGGSASGGGAGTLTCAPQNVMPIPDDCGGADRSYGTYEPLSQGQKVAVFIDTPLGGTITVSLENEGCSEAPVEIYSGPTSAGENCFEWESPGTYTRIRVAPSSAGSIAFQICANGACVME